MQQLGPVVVHWELGKEGRKKWGMVVLMGHLILSDRARGNGEAAYSI